MELFKLRYNLYKLLIKDDFKFNNINIVFNTFKNLSYITIIFFILIFLIGYEYINAFIIFFIIILIIFMYFIELIIDKLDKIKSDKYFKLYYEYYENINKIFNINYENINDIDNLKNSISDTNILINKIEIKNGGLGFTPYDEYIIIISQNVTISSTLNKKAITTANVKALSNGSLSKDVYNITHKTTSIYFNQNTDVEYFIAKSAISTVIDTFITANNSATASTADVNSAFATLTTSISGDNNPNPTIIAEFRAYFTPFLSDNNIKIYSISFMNLYENIKRNVEIMNNLLKEDIEDHINKEKKENDLLKYIDIYDKKYDFLSKYLIITEEKNEEFFKIIKENIYSNDVSPIIINNFIDIITEINKTKFLIDLELFESNKIKYKELYNIILNELKIKNLINSKKNYDDNIIKTITNYDLIYYYLLIILIIILTIIFHIFFINLY
jgi:hypothetical protein